MSHQKKKNFERGLNKQRKCLIRGKANVNISTNWSAEISFLDHQLHPDDPER